MVCLLENNPEVQEQLKKYADILGSKDAAYYVLSENNGYDLDKASNGNESELFKSLLNMFNGDEKKAIIAKSKIYTESFRKQLDNIKDLDNVSNLIDSNEEPLINFLFTQKQDDSKDSTKVNIQDLITDGEDITSDVLLSALEQYLPDNTKIKELFSLLKNSKVNIKLIDSGAEYMYYNPSDGTIYINTEAFYNSSVQYNIISLLHELVHAYTADIINLAEKGGATNEQQQIYNYIKQAYEEYKKQNENKAFTGDLYGLSNIYEFVSELLTNQKFLSRIVYGNTQVNSLQGILNNIKKVFIMLTNYIYSKLTGNQLNYNNLNTSKQIRSDIFNLISNRIQEGEITSDDLFYQDTRENGKLLRQQYENIGRYNFDTKEEFDKRMKNLRRELLTGQESRLKSIDTRDPINKAELEAQITYQIKNLQNEALSDFQVIYDFIYELKDDVRAVAKEVLDAYAGRTNALTDDRLIALNKNYFGFYCPFAQKLYNSLDGMSQYKQIVGEENYNKIQDMLSICKQLLDTCSHHVKRMQVENAKNTMIQVGNKVNLDTIYSYLEENTEETNFDISTLTRLFGSADRINDNALKTMYNMLQDTEDIIRHNTLTVGKKLINLLSKANYSQKDLFEVDENGLPTGYIIRDLLYGKMHKEYKQFLEDLRNRLGISANELSLPENRDIRIQYNIERNKWLSQHVERQYTSEYYDMFNSLSQETIDAREIIVVQIRDLKNKYRNKDGIVQYEKFTNDEWDKLTKLYLDKKQLASKYDIYGVEKPEGSVQRKIADELTELNEKLSKGLKNKVNLEKFNKVRDKKKAELSEKEFNKWYKRNTKQVYSEQFYEELAKIERKEYGEEYNKLNEQKRAILNMFRDTITGEINIKFMPNSTINLINRIDNQLRAIRKKKNRGRKADSEFNQIARIVPTEQFKQDYAKALADDATNPGSLQAFELQHTNVDANGIRYPKSYYTKIVPKNSDYISIQPTNEFIELDEESPYYNKNYDRTSNEYYQPKRSLYDNSKAYRKVMEDSNLKALRQELINTMKESYAKLDNLHNTNEYKLPQISGSMYRAIVAKGILNGIGNYVADGVLRKGDDVGLGQKVKTAPDGSSLSMIPQYYLEDLNDPATISADMVGSVIAFYRMAENFKQKSLVKGKLENIKYFIQQRRYTGSNTVGKVKSILKSKSDPKDGSDTNIYKFAQQFLNMNLYGIQTNSIIINIGNKEIDITKLINKARKLGTTVNLGLNYACAFTGFLTAMHSHIMNAYVGRYYNFNDYFHSFYDIIIDLFKYGPSLGRRQYKSEQMQLMDYFEVGSTLDSVFKNLNRNRVLETINRHWAFNAYSFSDYVIKGSVLNCVMYNYRNVDGNFISEEEYYQKYGKTPSTEMKWKSYKTFKGSIKLVQGVPVAIDKKDQEAVENIKFTIGNVSRNIGNQLDGALGPLQKAQFSANAFGALCMMHRQYLPMIIQTQFTMSKQYDYTSKKYVEAVVKTPFRLFAEMYKDRQNVSIINSFVNQFILHRGFKTELDRTNMKKLKLEIPLVFLLYPFISFVVNASADDDKKNVVLQLFAYVMARTSLESKSPYNLIDVYKTIKTPTPLYSLLDNYGDLVSIPVKSLFDLNKLILDEPDKKISRGAYKGMEQWQRSLIKTTPFKNLFELKDIPSKRRYYNTQIAGN